MTGSGKTTLAQLLLSAEEWAIAIDTKHDLDWKGWPITSSLKAVFSHQYKHIIFRPKNKQQLSLLFAKAYSEKGWYIYIDEVYHLGKQLLSPLHGESEYVKALTSGRSKGITVLTSTQRPKYLPLFALTESTHIFIFKLGSNDDLKDVFRMVGIPQLASNEKLLNHRFIYYNRLQDSAVISRVNKQKN